MIRKSIHGVFFCVLALLTACSPFGKKIDWTVSLDEKDKKPYGAYLAYQSLSYVFPSAQIIALSRGFRYSSIDEKMMYNSTGKSAFVAIGLDFYMSDTELDKLISFAETGNEVVIVARRMDKKLQQFLHCTIEDAGSEEMILRHEYDGTANLNVLTISGRQGKFGYQGKSIAAWFAQTDTVSFREEEKKFVDEAEMLSVRPDTLGFVSGMPNFIRYKIGEGHIILHAAPLVMSNYFLLQKNNKDYLQNIWNALPTGISKIYWNDYFKRNLHASDLSVLLRYPATRWAFIIAVFALLVYVVGESRRRQQIIPEIKLLENNSASFVETVGRLYYNKANHAHLGEKMVHHFLEWVRTHYFINTSRIDENFAKQLQVKSGLPETMVEALVDMIITVHIERKPISESELHDLYNTIQQFYKSRKK